MSEHGGQLPTHPKWWRRRDRTAEEVSRIAGQRISARTLRRMEHVVDAGSPELIAAMNARRISTAAAHELAYLTREQQIECLADSTLRRCVVALLRNVGGRT